MVESRYMFSRICFCGLVTKLCLTFCNPVDHSPQGSSSVHGGSQARILEWVATSSPRASSQTGEQSHIFIVGRWILYTEPPEKPSFSGTEFYPGCFIVYTCYINVHSFNFPFLSFSLFFLSFFLFTIC